MPAHPYFPGDGSNSSGAVNSVNGEQGDVVLTAQDLQAQPESSVLTEIAAITMPDNSFLMVSNTGDFTPAMCMPAGVAWLGYSTVDQQKAHLAYSEVADSGSYNDLSDTPELFSGSYNDLVNKPSIPAAQVNTDWNSTGGVSQLLNKPIFAAVALSGSYTDLTNKPTIPSVNYPVTSVNTKTGAVVLTATDVGAIATGSSIPYASLTGTPTSFTPSTHTHTISDVTGLQGALDSKASSSSLAGYATTSALTSGLSAKFDVPTGTNIQYVRGDGTLATFPVIPSVNYPVTSVNTKTGAVVLTNTDVGAAATVHSHVIADITGLQSSLDAKASTTSLSNYATTAALTSATTGLRKVETFLGTTDTSGNYTITFANTYSTPPDVQPQIINGTFNQMVRVVSISNTGCVVQAAQRNLVTLLSVEVLLGATVNLVGANVTVQVTARN